MNDGNTKASGPYAEVGDFAYLEVKSIESIGAFLDVGLPKDLFLPFSEQTRELRVGDGVCVRLYLDKSDRVTASMKIEKFIERAGIDYEFNEEVELFIVGETELGFKAVINSTHIGVLYRNEVFQPLKIGQRITGYIRKVREDGKIDLGLQASGVKGRDEVSEKILALLKARGGFLDVSDKSSAEVIYELFGVSKKKFKMAVGGLYKKKLISISDDGIRLV